MTRRRAQTALFTTVVCVVLYALVLSLNISNAQDPLATFFVVLASVSASALFLPEISSNLWTMSGRDIGRLVPEASRQSLARALIDAESEDDEWNKLVLTQALEPLIRAGREPSQVLWNMNYVTQIHLNTHHFVQDVELDVHSVEVTSVSERVLPPAGPDGYYWISAARTLSALSSQFLYPQCLGRELLTLDDSAGDVLPPEVWARVARSLCHVSVTINGQVQEVTLADDGAASDVIRWQFRPDAAESRSRVPIIITFDFPLRASESSFPVIFSGYYCAGATVVTCKVYDATGRIDLTCESFFARGLGVRGPGTDPSSSEGSVSQQVSFTTGRDSILWPGSGVIFNFQPQVGQ